MSKIDKTLEKINKQLKDILTNNPDFTGSVKINFFKGGVTNIEKRECIKIKDDIQKRIP